MKFGVTILVIVALAGCSRESVSSIPTAPAPPGAAPGPAAPPAPPAPPPGSGLLWVMVIDDGGGCIDGATIQILGAQGVGEPIPQKTPCGAWDYDGGLLLTTLTRDVTVLRGAAHGYAPREMSFFPMQGALRAVFIELSKTP